MAIVEKLLEMVSSNRMLYDQSDEDYTNIRRKDEIWAEIGQELNESCEDVKKKWKNLRDSYAKYIKTSRTASNKYKKKRWMWADHMEVFRPFLPFTQASSNTSDIDDENSVAEVLLLESKVEITENSILEHPENNLTGDTTDADPLHLRSTSKEPRIVASFQLPHSTQSSTLNINQSRQGSSRKRSAQASSSSAVETTNYYDNNTTTILYDGTDSLMLAHAKTIKTFSGRRQAITKMKIAEVIMEQELLHLEDDSSTEYLNYTIHQIEAPESNVIPKSNFSNIS